jgi:hypothetical protein
MIKETALTLLTVFKILARKNPREKILAQLRRKARAV